MQQAQSYRAQSRAYLSKAYAELDDDILQASEKAWGAAAQIVKAVAQARGWPHDKHGLLHRAVDNLMTETGDAEFRLLFAVAGELHTNFYENERDREGVLQRIQDVERFMEKLEGLL